MQTSNADDGLSLTFFCKDPDSKDDDDCASFYETDQGSWIVQGQRRGQEVAAQLRALKDDETFLEIPGALVELFVRKYLEEKHGADHGAGAQEVDRRRRP